MKKVMPIPVNLPNLNSGCISEKQIVQMAVLAALMHVKPDYRSPRKLDECAGIIADFVVGELEASRTPQR